MHIISVFLLTWIMQCGCHVNTNTRLSPLPHERVEYEEESGDVLDCEVNMARLEEMVENAVETRIEQLKTKFLSKMQGVRENLRHSKHRPHALQQFQEHRKDRLKSLEFRILKLSKDLEHTKAALAKQTESVELSKRLSQEHQIKANDISEKHSTLEDTVVTLADRIAQLAKALEINRINVPKADSRGRVVQNNVAVDSSRPYPKDCNEVYSEMSMLFQGNFYITIQPDAAVQPFTALCTVYDNKAWTVIQRRFNGSVDFYRTWDEYRSGFGTVHGEFWIGNDNIHHLTKNGKMSLRIVMKDWENVEYQAKYDHFKIGGEDELFRLHASGYHGNAGDSLTSKWESHDGHAFSTHDRDNDARFYDNCSEHFHGAWWFNSCFTSHLNGKYFPKETHKNYFIRNGIRWNTLHMYASLKSSMIMVAPRSERRS